MKYDWNKQRIELVVRQSDSFSEVLRKMDIPLAGNNMQTLKRKIKEYNIDTSHFTFGRHYKSGRDNFLYKSASTFLNSHTYISSCKLKKKLIKEGLKENRCELCGITKWMEQPISLHLHHINGNNRDNRLENLQILCPNCHSLTENYCGTIKNRRFYYCKDCGAIVSRNSQYCTKCSRLHHRKVERPSKETLLVLFRELKGFEKIGDKFNVSGKTISNWFRNYNLPYKSSELKKYILQHLNKICLTNS